MILIAFPSFSLGALFYLPLKGRAGGSFHVCLDPHSCRMQMAVKVEATRRLNATVKLGFLASLR